MTFEEYLALPCDKPECDKRATYRQNFGKFCNEHTDFSKPCHARDD